MFRPFTLTEQNLPEAKAAVLSQIEENERRVEELLKMKNKTYENFVRPYQLLSEKLDYLFTPVSHLNYVCNTPETEAVYNELLPKLTQYHTKLGQNKELYEAFGEIDRKERERLSAPRKKVLKDLLQSFELSGVALPEKQKERLAQIRLALSEATTAFAQNLMKATDAWEMILEEKEISELPKFAKEAARIEKEGEILYRFTLHQPSYIAFMTYSGDRERKERLYRAYTTRAPENETLIEKILSLRDEEAKLLGFPNYAALSLETKMAETPEAVIDFLENLARKSRPQAERELETLRKFAASQGFQGSLEAWDLAYWSEKLKIATLDVADEAYMPYFEKERTVEGLFDFVHKLLGVSFERVRTPLWHESATAYDLFRGDRILARLYLDLETREGKRGGAWMNDWVTHHLGEEGERILPIAFIVANFSAASENQPSLLRPDDVVTLFHEMGHALHHLLSEVEEPFVSGIHGVEWDAVEFPSQFLENFAYEYEVLGAFAKHYETGEPIPKEMVEKLKNAKNFQSAMGMLRQLEFALFDMRIHMGRYSASEVQRILDRTREEVAVLKPPRYNRFQWGFGHIFAGGYAAGYYSYKWAEVLSADAFFQFVDEGIFSENLSRSYYEEILAKGGSRSAMESFLAFSGREPRSEALLRLSGIKERREFHHV